MTILKTQIKLLGTLTKNKKVMKKQTDRRAYFIIILLVYKDK